MCLSELVCETACDANTHLFGLTKSKCLNLKEKSKEESPTSDNGLLISLLFSRRFSEGVHVDTCASG